MKKRSDRYFDWLKNQVDFLDFPETYNKLFSMLHNTPFVWIHPMDKNRALEASELRYAYASETQAPLPPMSDHATVLEFLISVAKRMNFICASFDEDKTKIIFWKLMANLDLARMSDPYYERAGGDGRVEIILERFLKRAYEPDGHGGLFPMQNPRENQREVEIWYQMNQYLSDPNGEDLKSY